MILRARIDLAGTDCLEDPFELRGQQTYAGQLGIERLDAVASLRDRSGGRTRP
jgi:hypothetical protein